jgi:purine-binding chemotaxis protein CheW
MKAAPTPERVREILEQRAEALARVPAETAADADGIEVVVFNLAGECYAIETTYVCEVAPLPPLALLPGAPDFFAGVVSLRGQMLAVIDLRRLFGLPVLEGIALRRLVVLGEGQPELGILAEVVSEIVRLPQGRLLDPAAPAGLTPEHVRGVTEQALIVLDGAALLGDGRLFIDQADEPAGLETKNARNQP